MHILKAWVTCTNHESGSISGNRKKFYKAVEKKRFLKAESGWEKEIINKQCIVSGKVAFLQGQMGSIGWINSLVQTRSFRVDWLKFTFGDGGGGLKLQLSYVLSLGLQTWDLAQVTPFGHVVSFVTALNDVFDKSKNEWQWIVTLVSLNSVLKISISISWPWIIIWEDQLSLK